MTTITRDALLDTARRNEIAAYDAYADAAAEVGIATRKAAAALVDWRAQENRLRIARARENRMRIVREQCIARAQEAIAAAIAKAD